MTTRAQHSFCKMVSVRRQLNCLPLYHDKESSNKYGNEWILENALTLKFFVLLYRQMLFERKLLNRKFVST